MNVQAPFSLLYLLFYFFASTLIMQCSPSKETDHYLLKSTFFKGAEAFAAVSQANSHTSNYILPTAFLCHFNWIWCSSLVCSLYFCIALSTTVKYLLSTFPAVTLYIKAVIEVSHQINKIRSIFSWNLPSKILVNPNLPDESVFSYDQEVQ